MKSKAIEHLEAQTVERKKKSVAYESFFVSNLVYAVS